MSEKPNVLLVTTDHWPGKLLGVAGHPCIQTPTLDQLARDGTRYNRAYSEVPVCIAARRTLMTGCTARTHGDRQFDELRPMPDLPTMAQTFRDAGYQAYGVGKLHIHPQRNRIGFDDVLLNGDTTAANNINADGATIATSFPEFLDLMNGLGAAMEAIGAPA